MDTLVYIWRRPCGEPFYVGIGREGRQNSRLRNRHTNSVRGSIERSGGSVIVEIVMRGTREECIAEEARLIALHGRVCDGGTLTNVTVGGECGVPGLVHSEESRARMSESHKGRKWSEAQRAALGSGTFLGKKHTEETKRLLREQRRGTRNMACWNVPHTDEHRQKIADSKRRNALERARAAGRNVTVCPRTNRLVYRAGPPSPSPGDDRPS